MRLAFSYETSEAWYFEFCTRDPAEAAQDIYPDVGCIHQGYDQPKQIDGRNLTLAEGLAIAEARARPFLYNELDRSIPIWHGAQLQRERKMRAEARQKALEEQMLAEERARLARVP